MTPAERVAALMASFAGPKVWFDPSDISTLFQDSAGTTPVAAAGDGIGRILDKSGAGNHATQTTTPSRPLWQTAYAALDGADDSWVTPNIDFTSTDKVTVVAGVRTATTTPMQLLIELGPNYASAAGRFNLTLNELRAGSFAFGRSSSVGPLVNQYCYEDVQIAPRSLVISIASDFAVGPAASAFLPRSNGLPWTGGFSGTGTRSSYTNEPLFIGRRNNASNPFNGNLYGLIIIGRMLSPDELWVCERYMAQQAGITI